MSTVVIEKVSKRFKIYHHRADSIKEKILARERYEEFWALKDVSITVKKGETLGIIGANGCGKSTLLKIIAGILRPNTGRIVVNGKIAALLELGAGFQGDLTGRENIYLNGAILGLSKKEIDKKYDDIVAFSELDHFIDNQVKNYSSGMYMRLGFAVAVNVNPDILLVDEVLAVGDEAFQKKCLEKIYEFQKAGKTILFVTHDMSTASQVCNRLVMLEKGVVKDQGKPAKIAKKYHSVMLGQFNENEWGSREATITSVKFLNCDGQEKSVFDFNQGMTIIINYKVQKKIPSLAAGIMIYDPKGREVYGTNTKLKGVDINTRIGEGAVKFHLDYLPLLPGKHGVTVALTSTDYKETYHWQEQSYIFKIENDAQDAGAICIPCEIEPIETSIEQTERRAIDQE